MTPDDLLRAGFIGRVDVTDLNTGSVATYVTDDIDDLEAVRALLDKDMTTP